MAQAGRDPRVSGGSSTSTSTRNDPRSRNNNPPTPAATPDPRVNNLQQSPPSLSPVQSSTTISAVITPHPRPAYDANKVINASLHHTGGIPYFLYKVSMDVSRPMLPKSIDPDDPKFKEDPRVRRYGRVGAPAPSDRQKPPATTEGGSRGVQSGGGTRRRTSGDNDNPDVRMQRMDSSSSSKHNTTDLRNNNSSSSSSNSAIPPPSIPKALVEPLNLPKLEPDPKALHLPEGLSKPLIPLPKLLDPRMGRQLSMEKEEKEKHKKEQTSPGTSSKKPFSHRNDPRFRKKSKDGHSAPSGLNTSSDSDTMNQHHTSLSPTTDPRTANKTQVTVNKHLDKMDDTEEEEHELSDFGGDTLSKDTEMDCKRFSPTQGHNYDSDPDLGGGDPPPTSTDRLIRKDPMEFASPLGYYSEAQTDSYNDGGGRYGAYRSHTTTSADTDTTTSVKDTVVMGGDQENSYPGQVNTTQHDLQLPDTDKSLKDMFNIDPTASPFGTI